MNAQTGIALDNFNGIDSTINQFIARWKINGGAVAISKNGRLIYNRGFGYADEKKSIRTQPDHLFRIASVSKPITSIAVMKLVESGKLKLSDTVFGEGEILDQPYYTQAINDRRIYSITVQNLLEHTAGWDRNTPYGGFSHCDPPFFPLSVTALENAPNPVGDSTLIKFLLHLPLNNDPGLSFSYSNIGYLVLGKVIEKISGKKYEDFVEKEIFQPLSINDIHLGRNLRENKLEREVEYDSGQLTASCYGDGAMVPWQYGGFNLEAMNSHGGWVATVSDLTRLMLAVDVSSTSPDILSPASINVMTTGSQANASYAKGWSVNARHNRWHTGSLDGTSAFIGMSNNGYTWAFLFNSRADNSMAFWNDLDRLPWNCLPTISDFPGLNLFAPARNVGGITANLGIDGTVELTWTNGNGDGRMIVVSGEPVMTWFPEDGATYSANAEFGEGNAVGEKTYVVYNGTEDHATLKNLDPLKTYFVRGYEYRKNKQTDEMEVYKIGGAEILAVTPGMPVSFKTVP
jgi:CubicO group peptidase (beta-lactamase class C family)